MTIACEDFVFMTSVSYRLLFPAYSLFSFELLCANVHGMPSMHLYKGSILRAKTRVKLWGAKVFIHLSKHFPKLRIIKQTKERAMFCPKMHFNFQIKI